MDYIVSNPCFTKDPMRQLYPVQKSNLVCNEGVCFIKDSMQPLGRTMFYPKRIISLRDNSLQKEYKRGTDWEWNDERCCLYLPEGSVIPFFDAREIRGEGIKPWDKKPAGFDENGKARIGNAVYCETAWHYEKTLYITYEADPAQTAEFPSRNFFRPDMLPKTIKRLKNKETIKVVFFGDSTHTGADTTSWYKREPFMPGYPVLFCRALEKIYGCKLEFTNNSVGGKDSVWGRQEFERAVLDEKPDLLLLGFGNNDCTFGAGLEKVLDNMKYMLNTTMSTFPECECVLLGPSINNPDSGFMATSYLLCAPYMQLERTGLRCCNFFEMGLDVLARKDFLSMSGNGIAHPNDWTTRVYATNLLSLFVDWEAPETVEAMRF